MTVIKMDEPQYAKIAATGFSVTDGALRALAARGRGVGALNSLPEGISTL